MKSKVNDGFVVQLAGCATAEPRSRGGDQTEEPVGPPSLDASTAARGGRDSPHDRVGVAVGCAACDHSRKQRVAREADLAAVTRGDRVRPVPGSGTGRRLDRARRRDRRRKA